MESFLNCCFWRARGGIRMDQDDWAAAESGSSGLGLRSRGEQLPLQSSMCLLIWDLKGKKVIYHVCSALWTLLLLWLLSPIVCTVNGSFKQLCNCIILVRGSSATEPQDNTYAPISVRILLWFLIIRLHWLDRSVKAASQSFKFLCHAFLSGLSAFVAGPAGQMEGTLLHPKSENAW